MLTQTTPHILTTAGSAQPAKPAAASFFGVAESKRAVLHEIKNVADVLKAFEDQVVRQSQQPAERPLPKELGDEKELAEALHRAILSLAVLKGLGRAVEGSFVKLPLTVSSNAAIFELMGETAEGVKGAVSAIQRVLEGAWISVRPIATIAARALGKEWIPEPTDTTQGWYVHIGREEFAKAFNVRGRRGVVAYLLYSVGDVEFGCVMARNVKAVAFVGRKKTLRVELLASVVEGLPANARVESVSLRDGEWVRLATLYIDVESGLMHLIPHVEVSEQVGVKPVLGERLTALALTDTGRGGRVLDSPDPALHLFYALAVGDVEVRVIGVTFTEAGPTVHFISRALSLTHVDKLLEEVRRELWAAGLPAPGINELRRSAKTAVVETIGKHVGDIKRVAKEARDSTELRYKLTELFDLVIRKAVEDYKKVRDEEERGKALWETVRTTMARKFFAENVEDPVWWTLLLLGDGVVSISHQRLGFVAKPGEVAETLLYVLAKALGVPPVVKRGGKYYAYFDRDTSRMAIERLFRSLKEMKIGGMSALWLFTVAAEWWLRVGVGGSNQPKLLSLLALRELAAGRVEEWLKTWLSYEAATARMPEAVSRVADEETYGVMIKIGEGSFDAYFEWRGKGFRLHTDLANFLLYCRKGARAEETLRKFARELRVEPKWHGSALDLPAKVGWALFLRLWHRYNMALLVVEGDRELLRVEVLEVRPDRSAKFRLWYYKWRETRPRQPYVDFELKPRQYKDGGIGFEGRVYANVAEGIYREHLAEIAELLRRERVRGVAYYKYEKRAFLQFTGVFRDSVFGKLDIAPELLEGEPVAVEYLGGSRFKIGDREVEFMERDVKGLEKFYAELKLASSEGAIKLGSSLRAVHVNTRVVGNVIRLDSDSFFGLLAATGAVPPGLTPLYRYENFHVYVRVKDGRIRYYFAVKHGGVWRIAKGESTRGQGKSSSSAPNTRS